jgi:uncharacterized protein (UPF0212 family)
MSKNDNILDVVDKNTGPRTCPECGYQFSLLLFVKRYVMKFGFPKWTCPSCHEFIKYNYTKSNLIGAVGFIICIFLFQVLLSKIGLDLPNFIFLIPYFFFVLVQLNFDKFEKY